MMAYNRYLIVDAAEIEQFEDIALADEEHLTDEAALEAGRALAEDYGLDAAWVFKVVGFVGTGER
jgi:hypothetical protein